MDFGKAFSFVFEDEGWIVKILLGSLIMLIPILGQLALAGYCITVLRNVQAGDPRPLPDWSNFGDYILDALKLWAVFLVYSLPVIILVCPFTLIITLPLLGIESEELFAILGGISGIASAVLICLMVLYAILLSLLRPVIQIRYAESGEIASCLRLGELFRFLIDNIGQLFISMLILWAIGVIVIPIVGTLTLGLLVLPVSVWMMILSSHLYGQIGSQSKQIEDDPFAV